MSALTGIRSLADALAEEPEMAPVREAVCAAAEVVPILARADEASAADLAVSLAVMEACAAEALFERGRVRRKLLAIAYGKARRARCALQIAVGWRSIDRDAALRADDALEAAADVLAPPERISLSALLRR